MEVEDQIKTTVSGVSIIALNFAAKKPFSKGDKLDLQVEPKVFYPSGKKDVFKIIPEVKIVEKRGI